MDHKRCETAHNAAWAGAAVSSAFGDNFLNDEQNKFKAEVAKFSLNAFSFFPALREGETRAGKNKQT